MSKKQAQQAADEWNAKWPPGKIFHKKSEVREHTFRYITLEKAGIHNFWGGRNGWMPAFMIADLDSGEVFRTAPPKDVI